MDARCAIVRRRNSEIIAFLPRSMAHAPNRRAGRRTGLAVSYLDDSGESESSLTRPARPAVHMVFLGRNTLRLNYHNSGVS